MSLFKWVPILILLAAFGAASPAVAQTTVTAQATEQPESAPAPESTSPPWQFSITPYVWAPSINGRLTFTRPLASLAPVPPSTVDIGVHVGPNKYLTHLNFAAMLTADARNGPWDVYTDIIDMSVSSSIASVDTVTGPGGRVEVPVNVSNSIRFSALLWTLGVSHTVVERGNTSLDLLAGFRLANVRPSLDWNFAEPLDILPRSGSVTRNVTIWDPIFGFRGSVGLGRSWFVPYYGDFGWGDKNSTYQGIIGVGYRFNHRQEIILVNRWMGYMMDNGPLNYIQFVGPTIGYRIPIY